VKKSQGLRRGIGLLLRLEAARDDILRQGPERVAEHAERVARAKRHGVDRLAAAAALDAIAKTRSYRLDGYRTFHAFAKAELGLAKSSVYRLRAREGGKAEEAAAAVERLGRWLRRRGIEPKSMTGHRHRGAPAVTVTLAAEDVAYLTRRGHRPK